MRFTAVLLACASTALGYTVLQPNPSQGWTNNGAQPVAWSRVATDRENITIVLTNPDRTLMPSDQVLAALIDGELGSTTVNPPSAGWPSPGTGYILRLVANVTNLNEILAQSSAFEIEEANVTATTTRTNAPGTQNTQTPGTQDRDAPPVDDTVGGNNGAASLAFPAAFAAIAGFVGAALL